MTSGSPHLGVSALPLVQARFGGRSGPNGAIGVTPGSPGIGIVTHGKGTGAKLAKAGTTAMMQPGWQQVCPMAWGLAGEA
jgi:hypothetical protein